MIIQGLLLIDAQRPPALGWVAVEGDRIAAMGDGPAKGHHDLGDSSTLICPGFIDAHLHLPQIDSIGCDGMDLLEWLERVVYPAETRWANPSIAAQQIRTAHRRMLEAGTLGYAGFLTSHHHGVDLVRRDRHERPLRAIVGQALMDRNAPASLLGHDVAPIDASTASRFAGSINPRYALSCSEQLLRRAGAMAKRDGAYVQTHLAETQCEVKQVHESFPDDPDYASVYDRHGLLTRRTLLAHCVHLSDAEWELIANRQAVVVHCPTANTFLKSGMFNIDKAREYGVRLALGSDIAAGPDVAMPRIARAMIETAKSRTMSGDSRGYIPTPADAWHIITRGNADALGWPDSGRLEVGAAADLLVLRLPFEVDEHLIGRLMYTWRDDYITHQIVAGERLQRADV